MHNVGKLQRCTAQWNENCTNISSSACGFCSRGEILRFAREPPDSKICLGSIYDQNLKCDFGTMLNQNTLFVLDRKQGAELSFNSSTKRQTGEK